MVVRGWAGSIATAIGAAACAGAAQLGLGYGLGIIAWQPSTNQATEAVWVAALTWTTWVAATATVAGACYAHRLTGAGDHRARAPLTSGGATADTGRSTEVAARRRPDVPATSAMWRVVLAVAAAVGAVVTVLLVAVPAQSAVRADTFSPQTIAGGCAVVGIILGLLVAVWALASPAVTANVTATMGWMWLLAMVSVVDRIVTDDRAVSTKLGVWQWTPDTDRFWFGAIYWPGAVVTLGAALLIGALAALPAARRGDSRVGVAVSGAIGPILVAAAYFVAAPRFVGVQGDQASAYLLAPYAVIAGLAGSVLVAAIRQRARGAGVPGTVGDFEDAATSARIAASTAGATAVPAGRLAGDSGSAAGQPSAGAAATSAARRTPATPPDVGPAASRGASTANRGAAAASRSASTVGLSRDDPDNDPPWIGTTAGQNPYPDKEAVAVPTSGTDEATPARGRATVARPRRAGQGAGDRPTTDEAKPRRPARRTSET